MKALEYFLPCLIIGALAYVIHTEGSEMDRLAEKLALAGGVVARVTKAIEDKADAVIAREAVMAQRTNDVFSGHDSILDDAVKALDALEAQLGQISNAPLPSSGVSLDGSGAVPQPPPAVSAPEVAPTPRFQS